MTTGLQDKSRIVHITFLDRSEIPESYRGKNYSVRCVGNDFYIGNDALTGALKDYAAERISEIDRNLVFKEQRRNKPVKDLVASEGVPGAWGIPDASF